MFIADAFNYFTSSSSTPEQSQRFSWNTQHNRGQVHLKHLLFRSHLTTFIIESTLVLAALKATPIAAQAAGIALAPAAPTALAVAAVAIPLILFAWHFKGILYDISLTFTVVDGVKNNKNWWNKIDDNVLLGGIPHKKHLDPLATSIGITHVLTMLEPFELQKGTIHPISFEMWAEKNVSVLQINAPDFNPVRPDWIDLGVKFIQAVRAQSGKVYVHCKAGRGRSATIVVAERVATRLLAEPNPSDDRLRAIIQEEVDAVKLIRDQIKLQKKQQKAIFTFAKNLLAERQKS